MTYVYQWIDNTWPYLSVLVCAFIFERYIKWRIINVLVELRGNAWLNEEVTSPREVLFEWVLLQQHPRVRRLALQASVTRLLVTAVLIEALLFRSPLLLVYDLGEQTWLYVVISASIFSSVHFMFGVGVLSQRMTQSGWNQSVPLSIRLSSFSWALCLGLITGAAVVHYHTLLAGILAHSLWNTFWVYGVPRLLTFGFDVRDYEASRVNRRSFLFFGRQG